MKPIYTLIAHTGRSIAAGVNNLFLYLNGKYAVHKEELINNRKNMEAILRDYDAVVDDSHEPDSIDEKRIDSIPEF